MNMNSVGRATMSLAVLGLCALTTPARAQEAPSTPRQAQDTVRRDQPTDSRQEPRRGRQPRRRRDVLTREEIDASGVANLYEAVQRLRPDWLRGGNMSNFGGGGTGVVVYQNNSPLGGLDGLRQLSPDFAVELRFVDGVTASNTLPGLGSRRVAGAIVIVTPGYAR